MSTYLPQLNEQTEQYNRTILTIKPCYIRYHPKDSVLGLFYVTSLMYGTCRIHFKSRMDALECNIPFKAVYPLPYHSGPPNSYLTYPNKFHLEPSIRDLKYPNTSLGPEWVRARTNVSAQDGDSSIDASLSDWPSTFGPSYVPRDHWWCSKSPSNACTRKAHWVSKMTATLARPGIELKKPIVRYKLSFYKTMRRNIADIAAEDFLWFDVLDGNPRDKLGGHTEGPLKVFDRSAWTIVIQLEEIVERVNCDREKETSSPTNAIQGDKILRNPADLQDRNTSGGNWLVGKFLGAFTKSNGNWSCRYTAKVSMSPNGIYGVPSQWVHVAVHLAAPLQKPSERSLMEREERTVTIWKNVRKCGEIREKIT